MRFCTPRPWDCSSSFTFSFLQISLLWVRYRGRSLKTKMVHFYRSMCHGVLPYRVRMSGKCMVGPAEAPKFCACFFIFMLLTVHASNLLQQSYFELCRPLCCLWVCIAIIVFVVKGFIIRRQRKTAQQQLVVGVASPRQKSNLSSIATLTLILLREYASTSNSTRQL